MKPRTVKANPFAPARYDRADAYAIKAVAKGKATEAQQRRAIDWIIRAAAMTYDETFVPGQPDLSDFLAGRRSVGLQVVKLINIPIELIQSDEPERKS